MDTQHLSDVRFESLNLAPVLFQGLEKAGFSSCTPIQAETLPLALSGQDVAGQAQTGTGKTAAFLLATLHHLLTRPAAPERRPTQPRALILAPTRELAVQIHKDALLLVEGTGMRLGLVFGGTAYEEQRQQLQNGVDILIGTPGRLIDYYKQQVYDLYAIQVVVLDEADRMFDLGFIKDIRYLLRRMPPPTKRLGLMFSATLSLRVSELAYEHMNNPIAVHIEPEKVTADRVDQAVYMTANDEKVSLLVGMLRHMDPHRTIVFVNTKRAADIVWGYLEGNGFKCAVLSGDVPQKKRLGLLEQFQAGKLQVLVATDVAARGLHIPDVSHVFNFDLPEEAEDYVHRIGRTARLGARGDAISFACERYSFSLPEIERYIGHKIAVQPVPVELLTELQPAVRPPEGSRNHPGKPGRHGHGVHAHRGGPPGGPHRSRSRRP